MFCSIQQSFTLHICLLYIFSFKKIQKNVYADKKSIQEKGKKLCLMGQIVIESHNFLEYWQNR